MTFYALAPQLADERRRQAALRDCGAARKRPGAVRHLVQLSARLFDASMAMATVITARRMVVIAAHGHPFADADRDVSFCAHVVAHPHAVTCVADAAEDIRFAGNPFVQGGPKVRFYVGAPLLTPCGAAIGALCALDTAPRHSVSDQQQQALSDLAGRVVTELLRR